MTMPGRVRLSIRLSRRAREATTKGPLIWRWEIGHYGGVIVDVPEQNHYLFRDRFPKGTFPKKETEKSVWQVYRNPEFAMKFEARWPQSKGRYYEVIFKDGTVAERLLTEGRILQDESAERPDYSD